MDKIASFKDRFHRSVVFMQNAFEIMKSPFVDASRS